MGQCFGDAVAVRLGAGKSSLVSDVFLDIAHGIAGSLKDFVNSYRTGATPMGDCRDNIKSLAMVFGAIESAKQGKRIQISI